ncbi:hypothetical protein C4F49_10105 [Sphingobacterium sp. KB22]|uniref:Uncharacterized protein n=1 Tax=Sphingobacterium hungaricum TaxID=2082723 RepID=A0A928V052_9SPHI|nr:hypothetical protein [Sphingobacterium hungaricum]
MVLTAGVGKVAAQTEERVPLEIDDLQIDVKSVKVDSKTDTAVIELFLISLGRNPREFKLNVFGTQVIDEKSNSNFITTIKFGRVLVSLADRQNYLHYLLQPDMPVLLSIKVANWSKTNKTKPAQVKLVFEDSKEVGKFIEQLVVLEEKPQL